MSSSRSTSYKLLCRALYPTFASALLVGCGSLPSSGPSSPRILSEAESPKRQGNYNLVRVNQEVVDTLRSREIASSDSGLSSLASPGAAKPGSSADRSSGLQRLGDVGSQTIAFGDTVGIAIFTSGGGLFMSPTTSTGSVGATQTALPPQLVDNTGSITVPYVGRVKVVNRSVSEVEKEIVDGLKAKAIDPWVIVSVQARNGGDLITVTGDVKLPTRLPVPLSGMRVLDAIAAAGGSGFRDYETMVSVMRGAKVRSEMLGEIIANSKKNITLQPGDTLILKARQWSFLTFGATGQNLNAFPSTELTLAEALATTRGLIDNQANPEAVFVYRFESQRTLESLGHTSGKMTPAGAPVIYQVNLREPNGFFIASQFSIRNKDIIFVGNAGTIGLIKAMGVVNTLTAPGRTALSTASGIDTLAP